ncbi:transmembrane protein 156 isoform X2 [Manis pentadactyla]|uniref:transmembrane protein 156 isoform X2 n=1 Tax=Manis pentadactyla TaxID=143292 RepID=UPI00255C7C21|nr:transmembrane protein 156 isoform X2 [Manis pentadactyla]
MTKTALIKLLLAMVIMFILVLPEYFKTPKGSKLESSCLEMCLQPDFTYSLSSLNFSFVTFLQPIRETQTIMGFFLNHSHFQNFTRICQDIKNEFKICSSCLACEFKGNMDFISQEPASKALIMKGPTEVKANDFYSPCQHFNFTVAPIVDHLEEYKITCNLKTHMRKSAITEDDPVKEKFINHTCGIMEYLNNCTHISLYLDKKSHKYKPTSVLLKGSDSEKLRALNIRVISETTHRLPLTQVKERLPPIPELEVASTVHQQDQYT